jgi:hypothetical protein
MTITDLLSRLDGVKARGGGWVALCPGHRDRDPSLSIRDGDRGVLLHCWAGCDLSAITDNLGISISALFHDTFPDPRQRREAMQRRAEERAAERAANQARGRQNDLLRQAEYLIQSARDVSIEIWSHDELDKRLNVLADAYEILEREHHDA